MAACVLDGRLKRSGWKYSRIKPGLGIRYRAPVITSDFISAQDSGLIRRRRLRFQLETLIELNCFLSLSLLLDRALVRTAQRSLASKPRLSLSLSLSLSYSISLPNGFRGCRGKTMPIDRPDNRPFRRTTAPTRSSERLANASLTSDSLPRYEKGTTWFSVKIEKREESKLHDGQRSCQSPGGTHNLDDFTLDACWSLSDRLVSRGTRCERLAATNNCLFIRL